MYVFIYATLSVFKSECRMCVTVLQNEDVYKKIFIFTLHKLEGIYIDKGK